ncbi:hypothetical protein nbrc107696_28510 [Gordonia spumicola]|uniref:Uncharacterized protein n=1 Tax=Gordonia spumicola TaxID=589161 RepID=A0A7I9VAR1_9ACTN|nr:hypothetical protein [Gordonia spumicola]GEE02405.1 hypothetical protein nbrc107696_28510 [Gordonia spumicola]
MKSKIITAVIALFVAVAALAGTTATAPEASARVASGTYTYTTVNFGVPSKSKAVIRGNALTVYAPAGVQRYHLHQTKSGGYFDFAGQRYVLNKRPGGRFSGKTYYGPFVIGHSTLVPRR